MWAWTQREGQQWLHHFLNKKVYVFNFVFCDTQQSGTPVNKKCCIKLLWQGLTESDSKWVWRTERSPARSETVPHFCNLGECPLLQLVNTQKKPKKQNKTWPTCSNSKSNNSSCWCELTLAEWAAKKQENIRKLSFLSAWVFIHVTSHVSSSLSSKKWSRRKVEFCTSGSQSLFLQFSCL